MKKLIAALCVSSALVLAAQAEDTTTTTPAPKKHEMTEEQKTVMKDMLAKYDTNKDGKLDKEERAKISADDKAKMEKAGLNHHKKPADADASKDSTTK